MNNRFFQGLFLLFASRAKIEPYPGWILGKKESGPGVLLKLRRRLWKLLKTPCLIRWVGGLRIYIYPGNEITRAIFLTGRYEPNEFAFLDKTLKPGMTFIDAGANTGLYTLFGAKKVGDHGTVLAIEPSDREFQRLEKHIDINALTNVRPVKVAISNCSGEVELLVATEEKSGHNTLGAFGYDSVKAQGKEWVHVERLDDVVKQAGLKRVDLIKMDIEGAEFFALQGAAEVLNQFHPIVLLELSDKSLKNQGCSSEQVWNFLTQMGYRIYGFGDDTGLPVPVDYSDHVGWEDIVAIYEQSEQK